MMSRNCLGEKEGAVREEGYYSNSSLLRFCVNDLKRVLTDDYTANDLTPGPAVDNGMQSICTSR